MADDEMINVDDINYAIYTIGKWENSYEINQIGLSSEIPATKNTLTHVKFSMEEIRNTKFSSSDKIVNGFVAIALHLNPKVQDMELEEVIKLEEEEFEIIKKHSLKGYAILKNIEENPKLAEVAKCHHERFDGKGYPDGISGFDIPEAARIIAVADAYDAMSSDRSYRKRLSDERIIEELTEGKGTQFDPKFADVMISIIKEEAGSMRKEDADE